MQQQQQPSAAPTPSSDPQTTRKIDEQLLAMLRCPVTLSKLRHEGDSLISEVGGLKYRIKDGIPVMLPEEAELPEGIESLDEFRKRFGGRR